MKTYRRKLHFIGGPLDRKSECIDFTHKKSFLKYIEDGQVCGETFYYQRNYKGWSMTETIILEAAAVLPVGDLDLGCVFLERWVLVSPSCSKIVKRIAAVIGELQTIEFNKRRYGSKEDTP